MTEEALTEIKVSSISLFWFLMIVIYFPIINITIDLVDKFCIKFEICFIMDKHVYCLY